MRFLAILLLPAICFAQVELQGRVITRDSTLRGVKGVTVTLVGQNLTAVTDSNGYWSMSKTTTQVSEKDRAAARPVSRNLQLVNGRLTLVIGGRDASGRLIAGSSTNVQDFSVSRSVAQGVAARTAAATVDTIKYTFDSCTSIYGSAPEAVPANNACAVATGRRNDGTYGSNLFLTDTVWSTVRPSTDTMVRSYDITVNPKIIHGYFKDPRDGQVYPYVTIMNPSFAKNPTQPRSTTWMTENLNFKADSSWVVNNSTDHEVKYGRVYTWAIAVGLPDKCNDTLFYGNPLCNTATNQSALDVGPNQISRARGVCPVGWHLPSAFEVAFIDSTPNTSSTGQGMSGGGSRLREIVQWQSFWGKGEDSVGFHAAPSNYIERSGIVPGTPVFSAWTTGVNAEPIKPGMSFVSNALRINGGMMSRQLPTVRRTRLSIRCVKN
jgi:uncharacterized protein (TIGR02145 family)